MEFELRSRTSTEKVYLRFINFTSRNVEIIWINFTGEYVKYGLLNRNHYVDLDTFKTHPWIAFDADTKERLMIDGCFVFYPMPLNEVYPDRNFAERTRKIVLIKIPVHSLRLRTLLEVAKLLTNLEDCELLELPIELKEDIKRVINQKNRIVYV